MRRFVGFDPVERFPGRPGMIDLVKVETGLEGGGILEGRLFIDQVFGVSRAGFSREAEARQRRATALLDEGNLVQTSAGGFGGKADGAGPYGNLAVLPDIRIFFDKRSQFDIRPGGIAHGKRETASVARPVIDAAVVIDAGKIDLAAEFDCYGFTGRGRSPAGFRGNMPPKIEEGDQQTDCRQRRHYGNIAPFDPFQRCGSRNRIGS